MDCLAAREDGPIGPNLRPRDSGSVVRWDGRVDMPGPASMLVFVVVLLILVVRERSRGESPGAERDGYQRQQGDM